MKLHAKDKIAGCVRSITLDGENVPRAVYADTTAGIVLTVEEGDFVTLLRGVVEVTFDSLPYPESEHVSIVERVAEIWHSVQQAWQSDFWDKNFGDPIPWQSVSEEEKQYLCCIAAVVCNGVPFDRAEWITPQVIRI